MRKPWYSRLGPLSWYRHQWFRFCVSFGAFLLLDAVMIRSMGRIHLSCDIGGSVLKRSLYGSPTEVQPIWSFVLRF